MLKSKTKQHFRLILQIFLVLTCCKVIAQETVQIGNGLITTWEYPLNASFGYGWSNFIYYSSEIAQSGEISSISFKSNGGTANLTNQKIYIRHTAETSFSGSHHPTTSGFQLVFSGPINISTEGWNKIIFQTPFNYNGTDHLEILMENRRGGYNLGPINFFCTNKISNRTRWNGNAAVFDTHCDYTDYCGITGNLPNIKIEFGTTNNDWCGVDAGTAFKTENANSTILSLNNYDGDFITWQWSVDGSNFSDLAGGNSNPMTVTPFATTYYRAYVKKHDGCEDYSNVISANGTGSNEETITLDEGTTQTFSIPTSKYYSYGWSNFMYYSSEIGNAGTITSVAFKHNLKNITLQNQKIYLRHTSANEYYSKSYPGTSGYTMVYNGSIQFTSSSSWTTITLDTPFEYNGTDNLEFLVENRNGAGNSSSTTIKFYVKEGLSQNRTIRNASSSSGVFSGCYGNTCSFHNYLPNIKITKQIGNLGNGTFTINTKNVNPGTFTYEAPGIAKTIVSSGTETSEFNISPDMPSGGGENVITLMAEDPFFPGDEEKSTELQIKYGANGLITGVKIKLEDGLYDLSEALYSLEDGNKILFVTGPEEAPNLNITISNLEGVVYKNVQGPFQINVPNIESFGNPQLKIFKDNSLIAHTSTLSWDGTTGESGLYKFLLMLDMPDNGETKEFYGQFIIE